MAGRPTKYNKEIVALAKDYLINFDKDGDVIPTIEGLALHINIVRDTIYLWIKRDDREEFSYIVSEILQKQARILVNKGLSSDFNASITKLMLTKHGYVDKVESTVDATVKVKEFNDMYND